MKALDNKSDLVRKFATSKASPTTQALPSRQDWEPDPGRFAQGSTPPTSAKPSPASAAKSNTH